MLRLIDYLIPSVNVFWDSILCRWVCSKWFSSRELLHIRLPFESRSAWNARFPCNPQWWCRHCVGCQQKVEESTVWLQFPFLMRAAQTWQTNWCVESLFGLFIHKKVKQLHPWVLVHPVGVTEQLERREKRRMMVESEPSKIWDLSCTLRGHAISAVQFPHRHPSAGACLTRYLPNPGLSNDMRCLVPWPVPTVWTNEALFGSMCRLIDNCSGSKSQNTDQTQCWASNNIHSIKPFCGSHNRKSYGQYDGYYWARLAVWSRTVFSTTSSKGVVCAFPETCGQELSLMLLPIHVGHSGWRLCTSYFQQIRRSQHECCAGHYWVSDRGFYAFRLLENAPPVFGYCRDKTISDYFDRRLFYDAQHSRFEANTQGEVTRLKFVLKRVLNIPNNLRLQSAVHQVRRDLTISSTSVLVTPSKSDNKRWITGFLSDEGLETNCKAGFRL